MADRPVGAGEKIQVRWVQREQLEGGELVDVPAELLTSSPQDALMEQAVSRLSLEPSVSAVTSPVRRGEADSKDDRDAGRPARARRLALFGRWRGQGAGHLGQIRQVNGFDQSDVGAGLPGAPS